jgi:hypothetical protein
MLCNAKLGVTTRSEGAGMEYVSRINTYHITFESWQA